MDSNVVRILSGTNVRMMMRRRTFIVSCAAAALAGKGLAWAEKPQKKVRISTLLKPWPRPPVKSLKFDEKLSPTYSSMAAVTPQPGTKRIYLQQPCDYKIVTARPDLKFLIYDATPEKSGHVNGYGFVIVHDSKAVSFDYDKTEQQFERDCLPLLTQRVSQGGFTFEQKSFTTTAADGRPLLMVRLTVIRQPGAPAQTLKLAWLTVKAPHSRFYSHPNEDYIVFEPWGPAWESPVPLKLTDNSQTDGETLFDVFKHSKNVTPGSSLTFDISFESEQEALIDLEIPYEGLRHTAEKTFAVSERDQLISLSFEKEYQRQSDLWSQKLADTAAIEVPEKIVQDIYHALTCNSLQMLGSGAGTSYLKPGQGGYNSFSTVYGWESSNYLSIMDHQGFHGEVRRVLDYFLTTQHGHKGPDGDISTAEGSFRPHIHWMCETGAILGIFADHAILSEDFKGLQQDAAALLKAARWIQGERTRTKDLLPDGSRSIHYGLMPPGRATDWPDYCYSLFTDAYTWRGLDKLAQAFEAGGLEEAVWLRAEAEDYRQCILASFKKLMKGQSPDPALKRESPANEEIPVLPSDMALLDSKLINANDDLVKDIEEDRRQNEGMSDLFAKRMPEMEDVPLMKIQERSAGGEIDLYYVNFDEKVWHRLWLERGERIKALRYFYMTLAYSTSRDVHLASERFCPQLIWLLPWQPNASGNGRILEMIFNSICLVENDSIKLLEGVPDEWFASGKPIGVQRLRTAYGSFSFSIKPNHGKTDIFEFSYEFTRDIPERFLLSLPAATSKPEARQVVRVDTQKLKKATCTIEAATGRVSFR